MRTAGLILLTLVACVLTTFMLTSVDKAVGKGGGAVCKPGKLIDPYVAGVIPDKGAFSTQLASAVKVHCIGDLLFSVAEMCIEANNNGVWSGVGFCPRIPVKPVTGSKARDSLVTTTASCRVPKGPRRFRNFRVRFRLFVKSEGGLGSLGPYNYSAGRVRWPC